MATQTRPVATLQDVMSALGCGRTTIYRRLHSDPDFPRPFGHGRIVRWYLDEIERYKESRPRRVYAAHDGA